jgi:hypothetical protein
LVPGSWASDGTLAACVVFHHDPLDFGRDMLRSLVIMQEYLKVAIASATDDTKNRNREMTYFAPALRRPEETCTAEMLAFLKKDCLRHIDMAHALNENVFENGLVCVPLLDLCDHFEYLKSWMTTHGGDQVIEIIRSCPGVEVSEIGGGWLAQHPRLGNANLTPLYVDLLRHILGDAPTATAGTE